MTDYEKIVDAARTALDVGVTRIPEAGQSLIFLDSCRHRNVAAVYFKNISGDIGGPWVHADTAGNREAPRDVICILQQCGDDWQGLSVGIGVAAAGSSRIGRFSNSGGVRPLGRGSVRLKLNSHRRFNVPLFAFYEVIYVPPNVITIDIHGHSRDVPPSRYLVLLWVKRSFTGNVQKERKPQVRGFDQEGKPIFLT